MSYELTIETVKNFVTQNRNTKNMFETFNTLFRYLKK